MGISPLRFSGADFFCTLFTQKERILKIREQLSLFIEFSHKEGSSLSVGEGRCRRQMGEAVTTPAVYQLLYLLYSPAPPIYAPAPV